MENTKQAQRTPREWIIGSGNAARWHVGQVTSNGNGQTLCGRHLYSPYGISHKAADRPSEIEHAVCARCDAALARAEGKS